jgi:DNA-binding GntR family transcriptional regulator
LFAIERDTMAENGSSAAAGRGGAPKLSRFSLRDQAVHALRTMIVSGSMPGGVRINEAELAATLGISRGPLREAIQRVGAEGLIEFRRNRGAFVREIAVEDIQDMYEARTVIEGLAARRAARWATDAQIAELSTQVEEVDTFLRLNPTTAYPADSDFHLRILELAHNSYLQRTGTDLHVQLRIARLRSGSSPERAREALDEHRSILSSIAARDQDAAGEAMARHLRCSLARLQGEPNPPASARGVG